MKAWDRIFTPPEPEIESAFLCDVEPEEVQWLWPRRIPRGTITVLDGDPGLGKSTLSLDIAARVSTGSRFPDEHTAPEGLVVILSAEDSLANTIRPRLEAAGADLAKVLAMTAVRGADGLASPLEIKGDIGRIARALPCAPVLVIIDPLTAYLPDEVNVNRDHEIRRCLLPLYQFASEQRCAVILIRHLKKSDHSHGALYAGGGSIAISGAARSVLMVGRHPEDPVKRVLASVKSNLSSTPPSLEFFIEPTLHGVPTIAWGLKPTMMTADELLASRKRPGAFRAD